MRQSSLRLTISTFGDWKGRASLPHNLHIKRSSMAPSPLRIGNIYGKLEHQQSANYFRSGQFTSKSTYWAFFNGSITFAPWHCLWKTWAPTNYKLFLYVSSHCPFYDQQDETVQHLLTTCVLAWEFWSQILTPLGLQDRTPTRWEKSLADWWWKATKRIPKEKKKGLNKWYGSWIQWEHKKMLALWNGLTPTSLGCLKRSEMSITFGAWRERVVHKR